MDESVKSRLTDDEDYYYRNTDSTYIKTNNNINITPLQLDTTSSYYSDTQSNPSTQTKSPTFTDMLKHATKSATKVYERVNNKVKSTAAHIHLTTSAAKELSADYLSKRKLDQERELRAQQGKVNITDAMLNIRGNFCDLPQIDKKWYVAVYPKANQVNVDITKDQMDETWRDNIDHDEVHHTHSHELPTHGVPTKFSQYQKILDWRSSSIQPITGRKAEYTRSVFMYPFSSQSFIDLSFYIHLLELSRYKSIEFCIFIEGPHDAEPLLPKSIVLEDEFGIPVARTDLGYVPKALDKKQSFQNIVASYLKKEKFIPGFYAEISLQRGSTFGPQGGRMHVSLKPNIPMLLNLPDGQKLANMTSLDILITLIPIAQPSTLYLRSFTSEHTPTSTYPSVLLDCLSCENIPTQWDQLNSGRATACGQFHGRILLGALNRSPKRTETILHEFNKYGKRIGKVLSNDGEERVILILSGHEHVALCYQNGAISFIRERTLTAADEEEGGAGEYLAHWTDPLTIQCHPFGAKIVSGCFLHHANLDILFTVDSTSGIALFILNRGKCIKFAYNPCFVPYEIKQICGYRCMLYLAHIDGSLTVLNLSTILNGDLDYVGQINRLIVTQEAVSAGGLCSIAVLAANDFVGIKNADSKRYGGRQVNSTENALRPLHSSNDNIKVCIYVFILFTYTILC